MDLGETENGKPKQDRSEKKKKKSQELPLGKTQFQAEWNHQLYTFFKQE